MSEEQQTESKKQTRIEILKDMWASDSEIDQLRIDDEIAKLPRLHKRYLDILTVLKVDVFRKNAEFLKLKGVRARYYSGALSREELQVYGWQQYQGKAATLKSEIERMLETDPVLLKAETNLFDLKVAFEYCESIMQSLRYRGHDLKTLVEYKKFLAGN